MRIFFILKDNSELYRQLIMIVFVFINLKDFLNYNKIISNGFIFQFRDCIKLFRIDFILIRWLVIYNFLGDLKLLVKINFGFMDLMKLVN